MGFHFMLVVFPKFLDVRKLCCKLPKIQTKRPNHTTFCPKNANGIANSEDPDLSAPLRQSDLSLHCLPRSVRKLRIITVTNLILYFILILFKTNNFIFFFENKYSPSMIFFLA